MAEFAHSEPDLASQPRYLPLVSMGSPLDWWSGSCIFGNCEVTPLYCNIVFCNIIRHATWPLRLSIPRQRKLMTEVMGMSTEHDLEVIGCCGLDTLLHTRPKELLEWHKFGLCACRREQIMRTTKVRHTQV